jgi:SAM-dependent methyltransferase
MTSPPSLRAAIVPPAMVARVQTLAQENVEVRTLRYILGEPKIYEWAHSIGACTDPVLETLVPDFPPRELRMLVAEPELELFLWTGILDLNTVLTAWETHGPRVAGRKPSILDFGCGCGRLSRFLVPCAPIAEIHAADVNPDLVAWCDASLDGITTIATKVAPPLPYAEGTFDLVYSLSVLTHLPAEALGPWLAELRRIMRPGGVLVATTHGTRALERIRNEAELQKIVGLDSGSAARMLGELPSAKVLYRPYGEDRLAVTRAGSQYGTTFLSEAHARALAESAGLEVVDLAPAGLRGWQDVLVARKR